MQRMFFAGTGISITTEGRKHLGAALGQRSYLEDYLGGNVKEWVNEVTALAEFATTQPQASYAAFMFGLRHRWTYFMRPYRILRNSLNRSSMLSRMFSYHHSQNIAALRLNENCWYCLRV